MSERGMLVRCIYCGTDKPPIRNELEYRDTEPWRCSECGESGVREDFYVLEKCNESATQVPSFAESRYIEGERVRQMDKYEDSGAVLSPLHYEGDTKTGKIGEAFDKAYRFMENYSTDIGALLKQEREAGIKEGKQMEREATIRYFKKMNKPYYVALFREGEHLK